MYTIVSHIQFLLKATNQHGVHSPFVYDYVTECLYGQKNYSSLKFENVLFKSISYFGAERVWVSPHQENTLKEIQGEFAPIRCDNGPFDVLAAELREAEDIIRSTSEEKKYHNDSLLLIENIYGNRARTSLWEKIKLMKEVRVTVDLFHCGAVFFRKEQAREHFKIRI